MATMGGEGAGKPLAGIAHPKAPEPREGRGLTLDDMLESNGGGCYFRQHDQEAPSGKLTFEQRPVKMRE